MHASKLPKPSPAPIASKAKTQGREQPKSAGRLSPLMMKSFGQTSDRVLQAARLKAQQQGKGTEGEKASGDPASAFQGSGHALPPALMAKYEGLLGGNVTLENVRLHQGASVDAALAETGLQGLTDGKNVAVSSRAERGTLEHEIGHVAQQQAKGFNLNEGTCGGYERDADGIAEKLVSDRPIEGFNVEAKLTSAPVQAGTDALQAKCAKCEGEERLMKKESSSELEQKQQKNELASPGESVAEIIFVAVIGTVVYIVDSAGSLISAALDGSWGDSYPTDAHLQAFVDAASNNCQLPPEGTKKLLSELFDIMQSLEAGNRVGVQLLIKDLANLDDASRQHLRNIQSVASAILPCMHKEAAQLLYEIIDMSVHFLRHRA